MTSTENRPAQSVALGDELKTSAVDICGDNATLPAKFVGCGQPIATIEELYRCTHCSAPFHLDCAEHHFKDSTVLTLQMVEEIERESLPHTGVLPMTTEHPTQTLAEGYELKTLREEYEALWSMYVDARAQIAEQKARGASNAA